MNTWAHFMKLVGPEDEELKRKHNSSHDNADCKYCLYAIIHNGEERIESLEESALTKISQTCHALRKV